MDRTPEPATAPPRTPPARQDGPFRGIDLVTVDVFDTLVTRVCGRPGDVFGIMALEHPDRLRASFATDRMAAERAARARAALAGREEVTLAGIYAEMAASGALDIGDVAWAMAEEVAAEERLCVARPAGRRLLEGYLAAGLRVVALSDMYLPEEAVRSILARCGLTGLDGVVVSSGPGLTKHSGALFAWLADREGVPFHRWLHVGDNPWADGSVPRRLGIRTLATPLPAAGPEEGALPGRLLDRAALLAEEGAPMPCDTSRFWQSVGTRIAAPLVIGFCDAVRRRADEVGADRIHFLARDGAIVMDAYRVLHADDPRPLHYLYASRRSAGMASIRTLDARSIRFLSEGRDGMSVSALLARAGVTCASAVARARDAAGGDGRLDRSQAEAALRACEPEILANAAREREAFLGYLEREGMRDGATVLVVDVGWQCSIQRALVGLVGDGARIHGMYVGTKPEAHMGFPAIDASGWLYEAGRPARPRRAVERCIEFVELLFAAPEHGVSGVARAGGAYVPVRQERPEEETRIHVAGHLRDAVLAVCASLAGTRTAALVPDTAAMVARRLERFLARPDGMAAETVGAVLHSAGFGGSAYNAIVDFPASWRSPRAVARCLVRSFWREGLAHAAPRRLRLPLLLATRTFVPAFRLAVAVRLATRRGPRAAAPGRGPSLLRGPTPAPDVG